MLLVVFEVEGATQNRGLVLSMRIKDQYCSLQFILTDGHVSLDGLTGGYQDTPRDPRWRWAMR